MEYKRIGPDYYKSVLKPKHDGSHQEELVRWKKSEIITDMGKEYLPKIEKYDGFTNQPSHTNYEQVIGNFYNRYHKVNHSFKAGDFPVTREFLQHIFGDQYEMGLDYISIIWKYPKQVLPILCLVSEARNTGKSTFLEYLKLIFQNNLTINTNDDFRSRFNSDWAYKIIIGIDEVLLQKREDSERLKHLSTAKSYKAESKGVDKVEVPFYGKFILCTNNEDSFIYIDDNEIRYWVVKVNKFTKEIPNLMDLLEEELPHFMFYLNKRRIIHEKVSRMWFHPKVIRTEALEKLQKGNENVVIRELKQVLLDDFDKFEVDELCYTTSDLVNKLKDLNLRVTPSRISFFLKNHLKLYCTNSCYKRYYLAIEPVTNEQKVEFERCKGRYYRFTRDVLK